MLLAAHGNGYQGYARDAVFSGHPQLTPHAPRKTPEVVDGVAAMRRVGIRANAKIVVGDDDRSAFDSALRWMENVLNLSLDSVVVREPSAKHWVRIRVGIQVDVLGIQV